MADSVSVCTKKLVIVKNFDKNIMKPLETGEDSNLLPISNAHSDNGTFVDSNLLSSSSPQLLLLLLF